jgi:hypothetical protein
MLQHQQVVKQLHLHLMPPKQTQTPETVLNPKLEFHSPLLPFSVLFSLKLIN